MPDGENPPVTMRDTGKMSKHDLENFALEMPSPSRPKITSQQSSSLPSTPYIHARKLPEECRTPSPVIKPNMTSPRSARSESDTGSRPSGRTGVCKFETGMAFSRRRIPYTLGGDKLERANATPKKSLDPEEEGNLSGDMRELYDRILPSKESEERRAKFLKKLDKILNDQWPNSNIKVHVFGSSGNLLCTSESDVDICITTTAKALERVCLLAQALADHGMERVVCVNHAKVPIVKIWDPELELACDMNVNNTLALENTRMIKTYVEIDPRVRPLAMIIKHWTRRRILNDAVQALGGTLSSYTWICMIINFLQTRNPPVLPCLHQRPHQRLVTIEGQLSSFADDVKSLRAFGKPNQETLGELLFHFYRRYGHEIDFEKDVISVRQGKLISKKEKKWHLMQNNRLCVEEPFNTGRNLGNTADDISWRGVHLELRRAFNLLSQVKLDECCEQYVFPLLEEKIWAKPVPQPRPVLSRSLSQSRAGGGRGGGGGSGSSRVGGHHQNGRHRAGTSTQRRASSAAALNKQPIHTQSVQGGQHALGDRSPGSHIHDQLYHSYQLLQAQEAQLRLQMLQQHQRAHAGFHAQNTAQLAPLQMTNLQFQQQNWDSLRRPSTMDPAPLSAPLRKMAYFSPVQLINNKPIQLPNLSSQPSVHTNPSSPSVSPAQLAQPDQRRTMRRSTTTDNNFSTLRSHSQPATNMRTQAQASRAVPTTTVPPNYPGGLLGLSTLQQYQQAYFRTQQSVEMQHPGEQTPEMPRAAGSPRVTPVFFENRIYEPAPNPKDYVGYYVDQPLPSRQEQDYSHMPVIPAYHDLAHRSRGISPSLTRLRSHASRSPSPVGQRVRDGSISFYSAASAPSSSQLGHGRSSTHSGPIIIDGSGEGPEYTSPPESLYYPMAVSEEASLSDEQRIDTPVTPSATTPSQEPLDMFTLDPQIEHTVKRPVPSILQFGDFPVRTTRRPSPTPRTENSAPTEIPHSSTSSRRDGAVESANGLGIDFAAPPSSSMNIVITPKRVSPPPVSSLSTQPPKVETDILQKPDITKALKPLPLLSPVREVRTPSPTANRLSGISDFYEKFGHARSGSGLSGEEIAPSQLSTDLVCGTGAGKTVNGKEKEKTSSISSSIPKMNGLVNGNIVSIPSTVPNHGNYSPKSPQVHPQSSSWKEAGKKNRKGKNKGGGSVSGFSVPIVGEGERKGG